MTAKGKYTGINSKTEMKHIVSLMYTDYASRQMIDMSCYELVVIYDKEYGEVIAFESDRFMNDSNDIVHEAIKLKLYEEKYRDKVRWAQCVSEYEFEYIKKGR